MCVCVCVAEDLIANCEALAKEKLEVREGDLLEIFPVDDQNTSWRYNTISTIAICSVIIAYGYTLFPCSFAA